MVTSPYKLDNAESLVVADSLVVLAVDIVVDRKLVVAVGIADIENTVYLHIAPDPIDHTVKGHTVMVAAVAVHTADTERVAHTPVVPPELLHLLGCHR